MEKNSKYSFVVNKEVKEKFKVYCKMMNVSPSDILTEIMVNFNNDVDEIIQMKDIGELQEMLQDKFKIAEKEIGLLKARKN